MGQIADLCPRALDDAPVVLDQRIGFVGERLDFSGKAAGKALSCALPDLGQRIAHSPQGLQPEQDGSGVNGDHAYAEQGKVGEQAALEGRDLLLQFRIVSHDPEARRTVLGVQHEFAFEDPQFLAVEAFGHVAALERRIERHLGNARGRD